MFTDRCVTVVGDRLVTVNKSEDIEVRLVHTGQVVHTIRKRDDSIWCVTPVSGHFELLVTGHANGAVHLWDTGDKGERACESMNINAGVHVRRIMQLEKRVDEITASSTRLMCLYDDYKTVAIVHFDKETS
jgi:WD40 repeat protein